MKFKTFIKHHWIKLVLIFFGIPLIVILIGLVVFGIQTFFNIDSFYRKMMLSGIPLQLYFTVISAVIFATIYMSFHYWFFFGGGVTKLGQKRIKSTDVNVRWADVIGMDNIKGEVTEVIKLIKDQIQVKEPSNKIIKGVLLVGPPGCGKTYLAKAIATETGMPFLSAVGSEFIGVFVGLGASRIKGLFKEARALAETHGGCIIFIDEIDTIARPRMSSLGMGAGMDYNATSNQLLTEMDGLRQATDNIVIFAATNVTEDELDPALMRAGRFDRKIYISKPGLKEREELFKFYLSKVYFDRETVEVDKLARISVGDTPADISNMVREASLISARNSSRVVTMRELYEARERIILGIKMDVQLSEKDRTLTAYHEAGHVIVAYLLVPTQDVFKASIIPRKAFGGVTWLGEREERMIPNKEELLGQIKIGLAGYAAEKIRFGVTSAGVSNDLSKIRDLVKKMILDWGMGPGGPGAISKQDKPWDLSDDYEDIIDGCMREVNEVLQKNKDVLERIAQELLKKDELNFDDLEAIFQEFGKTRLNEKKELEKKKEKDAVGWDDVIGMEEAKQESIEIVKLLRDRVKLKQVGGRIIRGLLLLGPPGCGKTYLASAIANEAGFAFITKSGAEFVEKYVGVGASRVRRLFQEAREKSLSEGGCIIFIDEIDALGAKRSIETGGGGQTEYNQTLNQLLAELDGMKEKDSQYNIVVIGATNAREDYLDAALLRPGRFDRKIYVDLPNLEDRKKLFQYYLSKVSYSSSEISFEKLAGVTAGWSPADISNLIREGILISARNEKEQMGLAEIDEARERVQLGHKRRITLSLQEKKFIAYHEAGHNVATFFFSPTTEMYKLSIIPRKETGGVSWSSEKVESFIESKDHLLARIRISLAGYVAEKLKCGVTTEGVDSDFAKALGLAHSMVWRWGMGKSGFIGNFHVLYEQRRSDLISETLKSKLDDETQDVLRTCLKETEELLTHESKLLDTLADELLKKEELNYEELAEIYARAGKKRPNPSV